MGNAIERREPTDRERDQLIFELRELAWKYARRRLPFEAVEPPGGMKADDFSEEEMCAMYLAQLAVLTELDKDCEGLARLMAAGAKARGADHQNLGDACGVTWQAARKRWGPLKPGDGHIAVVISRRNRVYQDPDDPRGSYGEVGGTGQYDSDRGAWPIGAEVREKAEYAIVAVDGTVERVYRIDPGGWEPDGAKWHFAGTLLTQHEIAAAYAAGSLPLRPGDSCPTRQGRAYRPHRF
ncbi:hypothetical protein [Streptomyces anulatus]|uniref:hypothetical protein n=1 Tax=Streptomyces anulatus TaxID=1892 RepID=UPI0033DBF5C4|nr:hypothetical protein OG238_31160 [Streptomyces anulatus]